VPKPLSPSPVLSFRESIPSYYLGLDPGDSGGLAALYLPPEEGTASIVSAVPMPDTEEGVLEWIRRWSPAGTLAVLEKVGGYMTPQKKEGDGFVAGSSAMFNFGWSYGGLRMALAAAGIRFSEVRPQDWQRKLGIPARGRQEKKTGFKNRLKRVAEGLYPQRTMTLAISDAVLLAEYCCRFRPVPGVPDDPDFG
jgi:hypothetical protein